jgi:hypothetical protein
LSHPCHPLPRSSCSVRRYFPPDHSLAPSPHYARTTRRDRGSDRPSLRAAGSVRRNAVGAAFPRRARDRGQPRQVSSGKEVCSAKTHGRGIDSGERGQVFERDCGGKLGGHSCHPRKVEAPDALCAADHPCPRRWPVLHSRKPGILGSRTLRRTDKYASGPVPQCCGMAARWHGHLRDLATASRA